MMRIQSLLFAAILTLLSSACSDFVKKDLQDCTNLFLPQPLFDFTYDDSDRRRDRVLAAMQDPLKVDPAGELLEPGGIYAMEKGRDGVQVQLLPFEGRDEFPFHPIAIDLTIHQNVPYLFVINEATRSSYSIEIFTVSKDKLLFYKRIRTHRLVEPYEIAGISPDLFYIMNRRRFQGWRSIFEHLIPGGWSFISMYNGGSWKPVITSLKEGSAIATNRKGDRLYIAERSRRHLLILEISSSTGVIYSEVNRIETESAVERIARTDGVELLLTLRPDGGGWSRDYPEREKEIPSRVLFVNPEISTARLIYQAHRDGVSGASSAALLGDRLILGQYTKGTVSVCEFNR